MSSKASNQIIEKIPVISNLELLLCLHDRLSEPWAIYFVDKRNNSLLPSNLSYRTQADAEVAIKAIKKYNKAVLHIHSQK